MGLRGLGVDKGFGGVAFAFREPKGCRQCRVCRVSEFCNLTPKIPQFSSNPDRDPQTIDSRAFNPELQTASHTVDAINPAFP